MVIAHLKKGEHDLTRPGAPRFVRPPVPWMHVALLDAEQPARPRRGTPVRSARGVRW